MKAERRQELRTNELSQQIDHVGEYVKQNAAILTAIIVAAAAIVGGAFWYIKRQQNSLMNGWAVLSDRNSTGDLSQRIDAFKDVVNENLDPDLTVQAWLRIGEAATMAMFKAPKADAVPATDKNYAQIAEDAYSKVLSLSPKDAMAVAQATVALGVLAENRGDMDHAKQQYQKVIDDARFADSPVREQAKYRLNNMAKWSAPVKFPPAPPPASQPASGSAGVPAMNPVPQGLPPGAERISPGEVPESVRRAAREAAANATTQPGGK